MKKQLPVGALQVLNQAIASAAVAAVERPSDENVWEFRCECGRSGCEAWVKLDIGAYEALRAAEEPILANGHAVDHPARTRAEAARLSEEARALREQAKLQALRAQRLATPAVLRDALAHAHAAVAIFTEDRQFLAVNDRYLELTGYSRDEVGQHRAGENLRLDPLDQAQFIELITAKISVGEADIVAKDGTPMAVEYVVVPTTVDAKRLFIGMMWPLVVDAD